ncbi:hypothetical protein KF7HA_02328 [Lactococcus lactis]|nr:hypothetical protein [Lactococcus lactis]
MTVTKQNVVTNDQGNKLRLDILIIAITPDDSNVNSGTLFKTYGDTTPLDTNGSIGNGTATKLSTLKLEISKALMAFQDGLDR